MEHVQDLEDFFPLPSLCGRILPLLEPGLAQASLVRLDCLQEQEARTMLSKQEQDYLQRLHHAKRRREWLGGRVAAKLALLKQPESNALRSLTILPDEHGRPVVTGEAAECGLSLSISHSGAYAAALATQSRSCGLDLQKISDKLPSLTAYFASADELELLNRHVENGSHASRLTMLWAAKEAVKKSVLSDKAAGFSKIELKRIVLTAQGQWQFDCAAQDVCRQTVLVCAFHVYALALTAPARFPAACG